jgi:polyhydroxyalkanoate synthesis regulator phasin
MSQEPQDAAEKLVRAYERMMERVHVTVEHAGSETIPNLRRYLDDAADKAVELGELTREEADRISGYIQRDVQDAAQFLNNRGEDISRWLRFDLELIEDRFQEMFSQVADRTCVELVALKERAFGPLPEEAYNTGEVTGPGTLRCAACGAELNFHKTAHIPPCPKCHKTEFERVEKQ